MFHRQISGMPAPGSFLSRALALTLILGLVGAGLPAPPAHAATDPVSADGVYLGNGDTVFFLDLAEIESLWQTLGTRRGSQSVTLYAARPLHSRVSTSETAPFTFGKTPAVDDMRILEWGVRPGPSGDIADDGQWDEVITWTVSSTSERLTSTLEAGLDRFTTSAPWSVVDEKAGFEKGGAEIEIDVNGTVVHLDPEAFIGLRRAVQGGEAAELDGIPLGLDSIALALHDPAGFTNRVQGLHLVDGRLRMDRNWRPGIQPVPTGCAALCMSCVASMLLSIGAYMGLIAVCGGALVTGGATALGCVGAFIGVQAAHFAMLGSCGRCYDCGDAVN